MSEDRTLADSRVAADSPLAASDEPVSDTSAASSPRPPVKRHRARGEVIGRYVILDLLGEGGMGVVYAAYDPELDRRVAVKLLRRGNDHRAHARLVREAQAMARVIHPNVITVHDVGTIDDGVFVAMELVEGEHLGHWVHAKARPWQEVVGTFVLAGKGLLAAHRAGVLHRDFKPANVLVGTNGGVRVLDFGLARQLDDSLESSAPSLPEDLASDLDSSRRRGSEQSLGLTRTGAILGTPAYMAPEQHLRHKLDARVDQFSFCVALFEALFGDRPFRGHNRVALAMATTRGEMEAPPKGHAVPARIVRAIVRGLRPQPEDRFASMAELLAELSHDPGRRRRQLGLGVAAVGLLAVGAYGYTREPPPPAAPACEGARDRLDDLWGADQRRAVDEAFLASGLPYAIESKRFVAQRLDRWADDWADAQTRACEATKVRAEVPEATYTLRTACLDRQRNDLAAVTRLLAEGEADALEHADRLAASLPAPQACDDLTTLGRLAPPSDATARATVQQVRAKLSDARALEEIGRYEAGRAIAEAAHETAQTTEYQPLLAEARLALGTLLDRTGKRAEAEAMLHAAARAANESRHDEVLAAAWLDLAWDLGMGQSRHDEALRWTEYGESVVNRMGRPDRLLSRVLCTRGPILWAKRDNELALDVLRQCLEIRERVMPGDPLIGNTLNYIGNSLIDLDRKEEAEASYRRALQVAQDAMGEQHPLVASAYNGLGVALYHQQRMAEAVEVYQRSYNINRMLLGPDAPELLYPLGNIAGCLREQGEYERALEQMWRVEALVRKNFPDEHREVGTTAHNIAELLALLDQPERAVEYYEKALPVRTKIHGDTHPFIANTLTGLAEVHLSQHRPAEALPMLERALTIREQAGAARKPNMGRTRFALARALTAMGREPARAHRLVTAAREDYEEVDGKLQTQRRDAMDRWLADHPAPSSDKPLAPP